MTAAPMPQIPLSDTGFLYGFGCFETVLVVNQKPVLLAEHFERLSASLAFLDIPCPLSLAEFESALGQWSTSEPAPTVVVNVYVTGGDRRIEKGRLQIGPPRVEGLARTFHKPAPQQLELRQDCWIRTATDAHKTLGYLRPIVEKQRTRLDDVVLVDANGWVQETTVSNLWFLQGGVAITPESDVILPGTVRHWLLKTPGPLPCTSRPIHCDELGDMDEIFLTNAVGGIIPVAHVEGYAHLYSKAGTTTLAKFYEESLL
ncbi:MAG: aminotransferase class IV [Candidatus Margulisiibacteriota bacterium]